ncbi:Fic family protein [Candidatus Binatus sp.]|uniref:Fic family protein n=1 Tax=Candidatus Binatus sp. TaxID=2811406 RepID=UPI003F9AFA06
MQQVDAVRSYITSSLQQKPFKLRVSHILKLNRVAIQGLNPFPGTFRVDEMEISKSRHHPPPPDAVPECVEEMCDYVNEHLGDKSPVHLSAYLLWRINWIHPFDDGNGRTARAVSYAVLCILLGYELPGTKTIPEQIADDKSPYYKALEVADEAYAKKQLNVSQLENLIENTLAAQLLKVHEKAIGKNLDRRL